MDTAEQSRAWGLRAQEPVLQRARWATGILPLEATARSHGVSAGGGHRGTGWRLDWDRALDSVPAGVGLRVGPQDTAAWVSRRQTGSTVGDSGSDAVVGPGGVPRGHGFHAPLWSRPCRRGVPALSQTWRGGAGHQGGSTTGL